MIEPNFENNKRLFLLIQKYKELLKDRDIFIENQIYVKILDIIGEIIECLKSIKEIDINRLEQLINFYNGILEKYYTIYPKDINAELDNLNNSFKNLSGKENINLIYGENNNSRISVETIELSNDIDLLIKYINDIIRIIEKYYKLNQYEVIKEDSPESRNPVVTAQLVTSTDIDKPSFFSRLIYRIKSFLGLNGVDIVGDSPYIEINNEKEFSEKKLLKNSDIKLQHIPNEEIQDYIDGKNEKFDKIDSLFYGLSNPRELILENNDNYYYVEDDDEAYIIADKTNTEPNRYKNTDTIICSDDNQYFRIVSDNTTIVYEEYKAESYLNNSGLFIRNPINSKNGREYIKYKKRENGPTSEYRFEEERNGMCNINIHCDKNATENINMLYDSKSDIVNGIRPKKIILNNVLHKYECERNKRNKYKVKHYMRSMGTNEWFEISSYIKSYKYNQVMDELGAIVESVDLNMVNLDIIQNGIKAAIPDKILQIYSKIHPEVSMMIKDYGKEQQEKIEMERN